MKFIIMQFSPRSIFLPFRSKYLPQHCSQKSLSLCSSLKVELLSEISTAKHCNQS
jgi:hypothetical protein